MKRRARRGFGAIRQLPSGRYQASYLNPSGIRVTAPITFGARADAEGYLASIRRDIDLGIWSKDEPSKAEVPSFGDFAIRHVSLQNTRTGQPLKPSTQELYSKLLNGHLKSFKARRLDSITKNDVDDWWIVVTANGKRTSCAKAYKLLSAVMKRALEDGHISTNPCAIRGAQTAQTGKIIYCPTPSEVAQMAAAIPEKYRPMFVLMAYAGLRFGEATELRVQDIKLVKHGNLEHFLVDVSRAVTYVNKHFIVGKPKSAASIRKVPLTPALNDFLAEFLMKEKIHKGQKDLLFPSKKDSSVHLRNDVFAKLFIAAKKKTKIEKDGFTPHSLRHFGGTYFAEAGANLVELKEWLGDSSTIAAQRYLHSTGRGPAIAQKMKFEI